MAGNAAVREYERRQAERRLPPSVRVELIERLRRGELLANAVQALRISTNQVWGRAHSDPEWGALLQATLDQARPANLRHGVQSSYTADVAARTAWARCAAQTANAARRLWRPDQIYPALQPQPGEPAVGSSHN
jgi:hypothetical protein